MTLGAGKRGCDGWSLRRRLRASLRRRRRTDELSGVELNGRKSQLVGFKRYRPVGISPNQGFNRNARARLRLPTRYSIDHVVRADGLVRRPGHDVVLGENCVDNKILGEYELYVGWCLRNERRKESPRDKGSGLKRPVDGAGAKKLNVYRARRARERKPHAKELVLARAARGVELRPEGSNTTGCQVVYLTCCLRIDFGKERVRVVEHVLKREPRASLGRCARESW